jgi:hypothetical protein
VGRGERGRAQKSDQVLAFGTKARLIAKKTVKACENLRVSGLLLKVLIVEQLHKGRKGRIEVVDPEHQHFFEGNLTIWHTTGRALDPCFDADLAPIRRQRWKLVREAV